MACRRPTAAKSGTRWSSYPCRPTVSTTSHTLLECNNGELYIQNLGKSFDQKRSEIILESYNILL